jgi:Fic family protein
MGQLELFLHDDKQELPLLIRAGLVHVQFESIHPFLDGNGRLGRLLITFQLCVGGALHEPPVSELVLQDASATLLRSSDAGANGRRLGSLARFFF